MGLMLILLLVLGLGAVPGETWALLNDTIRLEAEAIASFTEKRLYGLNYSTVATNFKI